MHNGVVLFAMEGGLFDETEDATVESAFRYALLRINQDRTLLPDTRIVYDIQHLPAQNSFMAAKKGTHEHYTTAVITHTSTPQVAYNTDICFGDVIIITFV